MADPSTSTDRSPARRRLPVLEGVLPVRTGGLRLDVIAGTTLAALGIPEVMGYAKIAGMPVVLGLYTLLAPIIVFALLGSSRHLVVGADSATAAVLAAGLAGLAVAGSSRYVELGVIAALLTGVVLLLARLVRLGFLADFLSRSVLIGFLTGVGIQVALDQLGGMLGISGGSGGTIEKTWTVLTHLSSISWPTVAVSAAVIGVIFASKAISKKIPGALVAVVGAIIVSEAADLQAHGISVLGHVPGGLPHLGVPTTGWNEVPKLLATVGAVVLVILAQSAATARAYAAKYEERFDENLDLVGLSAANLAAGLTGTFVVNGSPTKTQMVDSAGGRSQISQLTTAAVIVVVLLFLTGPLAYLPNAVLAAVVFVIGIELIDLAGMRRVLAYRRAEFAIALATIVMVVVVGVEQGVILAVILSLLDYVRRGYRPPRAVLSPNERGHLHSHRVESKETAGPGLIIYRFGADLFYANAAIFSSDVLSLAASVEGGWLCIDASAISDVDFSGYQALSALREEVHKHKVHLVMSGLIHPTHNELLRQGLIGEMGTDAIFDSAADVVDAKKKADEQGSGA